MRLRNSGENRRSSSRDDLALHLFDADLPGQEAERAGQLAEVLGADVRRHDHDRVAQVDALAAAVGDPALVERLQEQVQQCSGSPFRLRRAARRSTGCPSADWSARRRARMPTMPRGMPISLSTPTAPSWYSDMSTRIIFFSSPNRNVGHRLGQFGLADAGRPEEQQHAVGPVEAVLERPLVQHQPARHRVDRLAAARRRARRAAPRCP